MQESPPRRINDYEYPSIKIEITMFTSIEVIEAVRKALEALEDEYGLYLGFELINVNLANPGICFGDVEAVIDVFGSKLVITREIVDDDIKLSELKDKIISEALRNIGKLYDLDEINTIPSDTREPPNLTTAIFDDDLITITQ